MIRKLFISRTLVVKASQTPLVFLMFRLWPDPIMTSNFHYPRELIEKTSDCWLNTKNLIYANLPSSSPPTRTLLQKNTPSFSNTNCSTVQYITVQWSTVQFSTVQYSAVQCSTVQYSAVQCSIVQYSAVQCSTVQYSAAQCNTNADSAVHFSKVQYSTKQCSPVSSLKVWIFTYFRRDEVMFRKE